MQNPMARVTMLQFRNVAPQPGAHPTMPVLTIHFETFHGHHDSHDLVNPKWLPSNKALQWLALREWKPSDVDGTAMVPEQMYVRVVPTDGGWALARTELMGGRGALEDAAWFDSVDHSDDDETAHDASHGGSHDPDGGAKMVATIDPEDDRGVTMHVE